ncbi:MAG: LysM peptidoglycan-binding domain-containing protein, partial [Cyclobacteriaceae bacterium]|nr:LysM peptidoglycan-binding domain-containing protein [Cyclobacteriaceae bacterium]
HADNIGGSSYNQQLSSKRTQSAVDYLKLLGVQESNLTMQSQGEDRPMVTTTTPYSRQLNRRVELSLKDFPSDYTPRFHTVMVRPGINLGALAQVMGSSVEEIKQWNGLKSSALRRYQPIRLPLDQVENYKDLVYLPAISADQEDAQYHQVVYGETLFRLAVKYQTTVQALEQLNGLEPRDLKAGQRIRVR